MISRLVFIFMAALAMAACGSQKRVVETPNGTVEMLSSKKALKKIAQKPDAAQWVRIKSNVSVTQNGSTQKGGAEIRMCQDSIMWAEISDPIIGLKVIRAFAMADTVAMMNKIDRTYFAGSYAKVEQKLGTSIAFPLIFNVFQGALFVQDVDLETIETHYTIKGEDANGNLMIAEMEPFHFDVVHQKYRSKTDMIDVIYSDYREIDGYRYPFNIKVEVSGREQLKADFSVKTLETGGPWKTPFKVSSKYDRLD